MMDAHDPRRPGRGPVASSVVLHLAAGLMAWLGQSWAQRPMEFVAYEMNLVTFADLEEPEEFTVAQTDLEVETPDDPPPTPPREPEPPPPDPEPAPTPTPPRPPPERRPERPPEPAPQPREQPAPAPQRERPPEATSPEATSSSEIVARMEGLRRDYPAYYDQIQREIYRCFRPPAGVDRATTIVRFEIRRDGRVPNSSIRLFQRSGNTSFDLTAVAAVECAGAGRFGPLPEDLPFDALPVQFTFSPRGSEER
jgi:outer membrane biosynthesis protein TonB